MRAGGVEIVLNAHGIEVEGAAGGGFRVQCSQGEFVAGALVVATGGFRFRSWERRDWVMRWRGSLGLRWWSRGRHWCRWCWVEMRRAGRSWRAWQRRWRCGRRAGGEARFREKMLVTHRGLSGPAVLQASSYWRAGEELVVDLAPETDVLGGTDGAGGTAG